MSDWDGSGLRSRSGSAHYDRALSGILSLQPLAFLMNGRAVCHCSRNYCSHGSSTLGLLTWQFGAPTASEPQPCSAEAEAVISLVAEKLSDLAGSLYG